MTLRYIRYTSEDNRSFEELMEARKSQFVANNITNIAPLQPRDCVGRDWMGTKRVVSVPSLDCALLAGVLLTRAG